MNEKKSSSACYTFRGRLPRLEVRSEYDK